MNGTIYRKLTDAEIRILETNGCSAANWSCLEVTEAFVPNGIARCRFSGTIRIGKNVRIDGIRETIENYEIGDHVTIIHTESLVANPESTFGNGIRVAVLNESGGREVPIYNGLTAQTAYLAAMYRHRPEVLQTVEKLVAVEIQSTTPELGRIGAGTYIAHCGALTDICTGENAVLKGVAELTNGTVDSTPDAPTTIGRGVIARDFIVADGAEVTDFSHIEKCFIGQGCRIGKGFTAQNSLFFANCECEQGEACAVFAGPYTVTHHKSTLLIGGMFSFYNAGSNSNQSNHMYRLGPAHQGILDRGCKTGSGSYILFPAHIGAFSVVKGRHYVHPDTAALPFSYVLEENGKTVLLPGAHIKSIGLARDAYKWAGRDRRNGIRRDHLVFDVFSPYTVEKIVAGLALLNEMDATEDACYNDILIPARQIGRGREIYRTAIDKYLGDVILKRIRTKKPLSSEGCSPRTWIDLSGLIAPQAEVEHILEILPSMHSIHELSLALTGLYEHYGEWEWLYAASLLHSEKGKPVNEFTKDDWLQVIENGISASETLLKWRMMDAEKEFGEKMRAGYGLDQGEKDRNAEFTAIHGTPESHAFIKQIRKETIGEITKAKELAKNIKGL